MDIPNQYKIVDPVWINKKNNDCEDKQMPKKLPISTIVDTVVSVATDKSVQKALFGVYSDNTPRSLVDCLDGEILSPKDRAKAMNRKKKKKNKKKSKNKL